MLPLAERHIEWTAPASLWDGFNGPTTRAQRGIFVTPAILRFARDSFIDDFIAIMHSDPRKLADLLAGPETWTKPQPEVEVPAPKHGLMRRLERARTAAVRRLEARGAVVRSQPWNEPPSTRPLKLFHPAHQRYYLVAACLVCRTIGLPDRRIDTTRQEKATFVLRMLHDVLDPRGYVEMAMVGGVWKPADDPTALQEGEERYPLSPLTYTADDGRQRRLLHGLIPVAKRESLIGAHAPLPAGATPSRIVDERELALESRAIGPLDNLVDVAKLAQEQNEVLGGSSPDPNPAVKHANEQIQAVTWYALLDLSHWLEDNLNAVWTAITTGNHASLTGKKLDAFNALAGVHALDGGGSLVDALKNVRAAESLLESATTPYSAGNLEWPSFTFVLVKAFVDDTSNETKTTGGTVTSAFKEALVAALDFPVASSRPVAQVAATPHASPRFVVRCVFERPNCGALSPPLVSDPTAAFQLAGFFDVDAPARPIRVSMPVDTTPAGLRKFDKNTAFVLSDVLCGQVNALRGMTFGSLVRAVLPWPFYKDLRASTSSLGPCTGGSGTVCSLSIPIITICALVLLMIIVKLLDMVFFWMPFFQICLPVPNHRAKVL